VKSCIFPRIKRHRTTAVAPAYNHSRWCAGVPPVHHQKPSLWLFCPSRGSARRSDGRYISKGSTLLELQLLGILKKSRSLNLQRLRTHAWRNGGSPDIWQPWKELFVPALGAAMLHVFFSSAFKGHVKAAVGQVKVTAGENRDLHTTERALTGEQQFLPTPVSPGAAITNTQGPAAVSSSRPDRARERLLLPPPLISLALPPPFISFGFSPLIKLLACRNV